MYYQQVTLQFLLSSLDNLVIFQKLIFKEEISFRDQKNNLEFTVMTQQIVITFSKLLFNKLNFGLWILLFVIFHICLIIDDPRDSVK